MKQAKCSKCGRPVVYAPTATGKTVCLDAEPNGGPWTLTRVQGRRRATTDGPGGHSRHNRVCPALRPATTPAPM